MQLTRVAKEDVKMAEAIFRNAQRKTVEHEQAMQRENLQITIKGQQDSAKIAEEEKRKTKLAEIEGDVKKSEVVALANNQTAVVNMVASWLKPTTEGGMGTVPPQYKPIVDGVFNNILIGVIAQTEEQKQKMMAAFEQAQMQEQQPEQQPEQNIQQPQQPMAAA
jgi:hypothetical protein